MLTCNGRRCREVELGDEKDVDVGDGAVPLDVDNLSYGQVGGPGVGIREGAASINGRILSRYILRRHIKEKTQEHADKIEYHVGDDIEMLAARMVRQRLTRSTTAKCIIWGAKQSPETRKNVQSKARNSIKMAVGQF